MSDKQIPDEPKRTLRRALPKILQHGGPVIIFGAKRPPSENGNAPSSNPDVPTLDPPANQASGRTRYGGGQE